MNPRALDTGDSRPFDHYCAGEAEIAGSIGAAHPGAAALLLQLYGLALFGLATTGWMVKDAITGGIFGRSYVVGNAGQAIVGALARRNRTGALGE